MKRLLGMRRFVSSTNMRVLRSFALMLAVLMVASSAFCFTTAVYAISENSSEEISVEKVDEEISNRIDQLNNKYPGAGLKYEDFKVFSETINNLSKKEFAELYSEIINAGPTRIFTAKTDDSESVLYV